MALEADQRTLTHARENDSILPDEMERGK